jgi:hypothetical protein
MKSGSFEPDFFCALYARRVTIYAIKLKLVTYVLIIENI